MCGGNYEGDNYSPRKRKLDGKKGGKLFFLPDSGNGPASMFLPRKLKASSLKEALKEVQKITDCYSGIICQQIAP